MMEEARDSILQYDTALGICLGDATVTAVLLGQYHNILACGQGNSPAACFSDLRQHVLNQYGVPISRIGAIALCSEGDGVGPDTKAGLTKAGLLQKQLTGVSCLGRLSETVLGISGSDHGIRIFGPGTCAGSLTKEGAGLLDETGTLCDGIPFAAPNVVTYSLGSIWERIVIASNNGRLHASIPDGFEKSFGAALMAAYYNWSNNSEDFDYYCDTYVFWKT